MRSCGLCAGCAQREVTTGERLRSDGHETAKGYERGRCGRESKNHVGNTPAWRQRRSAAIPDRDRNTDFRASKGQAATILPAQQHRQRAIVVRSVHPRNGIRSMVRRALAGSQETGHDKRGRQHGGRDPMLHIGIVPKGLRRHNVPSDLPVGLSRPHDDAGRSELVEGAVPAWAIEPLAEEVHPAAADSGEFYTPLQVARIVRKGLRNGALGFLPDLLPHLPRIGGSSIARLWRRSRRRTSKRGARQKAGIWRGTERS